jgi:DNA-binding GntR family transcriptional regulator
MPTKRATASADAAAPETRKAASTHEVILDMRERIASQALLPGTRVPEEDLAQAYDIPRAKAREVLATLEDRALVERVPNKGAVVALVDMETTYRLYQVREALDGLAVRLAMANATPADWEAMQALLGEPFEQSVATIEQFRNHIKELARNPVLSDMIERIYDRTRVSMRRVALLPGRSEMGIKQYRALLDAMVRGDGDEAERCVRELNGSARDYIERYKNYVI